MLGRVRTDALARLRERPDHGLVEALAHRALGALDVACAGAPPSSAFATRKKRPTTAATPRSSSESPTAMHSSGA